MVTTPVKAATRGERNNNPGNIDRNTIKWKGMAPIQTGDKRFVVFIDPIWGIRALARCLLSYSTLYPEGSKQDIDCVQDIIRRWAPSSENNTAAYVHSVANEVGVKPEQAIEIDNEEMMTKLVTAIIRHENGRVIYTKSQIANAIDRALA